MCAPLHTLLCPGTVQEPYKGESLERKERRTSFLVLLRLSGEPINPLGGSCSLALSSSQKAS